MDKMTLKYNDIVFDENSIRSLFNFLALKYCYFDAEELKKIKITGVEYKSVVNLAYNDRAYCIVSYYNDSYTNSYHDEFFITEDNIIDYINIVRNNKIDMLIC